MVEDKEKKDEIPPMKNWELLGKSNVECPRCGSPAKVTTFRGEIPFFGKIILLNVYCDKCGFKTNDVFSDEEKPPYRYILKINDAEDIDNILIVKSSTSFIKIPELGIYIEPKSLSEGFISTIDGFFERVEKLILAWKEGLEERDVEKIVERELETLKAAKEGKIGYTFILEDPYGNGSIHGKNVEKEKLKKNEIEKLKRLLEE